MKRGYVDVPEGQVHYRTEGAGESIILLHMASSSSNEYTRVIPFLSPKYRAIAIDLLGFGESDKPPRKFLMEDHARTVFQVMDAMGIASATVVGTHAGSQIGVEMAVTRPKRVDRLVMFGLPFFKTEAEFIAHSSKPVFTPVTIKPDGSHLVEWWQRSIRYGDSAQIADERTLDFHKAGERSEELHEAAFAYVPKLRGKLPAVKCPALLIAGGKDHYAAVQSEVQKLIPRSRVVTIPDGPVLITRVMPKEFAAAILDFMANQGV